jgi:hypothetical protein
MRITWKNHPLKPELNGTKDHVSRELAAVAVGYGQAEYAPYRSYVERLSEESKFRTQAAPGDTVVEFFKDPQWSVGFVTAHPTIFRKWGYETVRFCGEKAAEQAKANHCPERILKQYENLLAQEDNSSAGAVAERQAEQVQNDLAANIAKYKYLA